MFKQIIRVLSTAAVAEEGVRVTLRASFKFVCVCVCAYVVL